MSTPTKKYNLKNPLHVKYDVNKAAELFKAGVPITKISRALDIPEITLRRLKNKGVLTRDEKLEK